jgi:hypothetical protein
MIAPAAASIVSPSTVNDSNHLTASKEPAFGLSPPGYASRQGRSLIDVESHA